MKFKLLLTVATFGLLGLAACSPKNNSSNTEGASAEQATMAKEKDPAELATTRIESLGITLTEEQKQKIAEISSSYNFEDVQSKEERQALRRQFREEVMQNVLTPEQQALVPEKKGKGE